MEVHILASGSKGNCAYIETDKHYMFVDVGISYLTLKEKIKKIGKDIEKINTLFITHEHIDHIKGLKTLLKAGHIERLYITKGTLDVLPADIKPFLPLETVIIAADEKYFLDGFLIKTFMLSHDAKEPVGFVFEYLDKKIVFLTDTGYVDQSYDELLSNADLYILEANHDAYKLMHSARPFLLKRRILSEKGHLSNEDAVLLINKYVHKDKFAYWVAAHISEDCNTVLDIEEAVVKILDDPTKIELLISSQETLEVIKL